MSRPCWSTVVHRGRCIDGRDHGCVTAQAPREDGCRYPWVRVVLTILLASPMASFMASVESLSSPLDVVLWLD